MLVLDELYRKIDGPLLLMKDHRFSLLHKSRAELGGVLTWSGRQDVRMSGRDLDEIQLQTRKKLDFSADGVNEPWCAAPPGTCRMASSPFNVYVSKGALAGYELAILVNGQNRLRMQVLALSQSDLVSPIW